MKKFVSRKKIYLPFSRGDVGGPGLLPGPVVGPETEYQAGQQQGEEQQ
jgi:hypothetical protein